MSTIYVFNDEMASLTTVANADVLLVHDASAGLKKDITVSNIATAVFGAAAANVIGFYGVTKVNQGTMTATCLTAVGVTTISAANTNTVYGFSTSTAAKALVKRTAQIQDNLEILMARIDSTGLVAIAGVP
jgi:hypothetical protein